MTDTKIYKADVGIEIVLQTGQDLTNVSKMEIHAQRPDGVIKAWTAVKHATSGAITYTTIADDLPVAGDYLLQAYCEWGTSKYHGETVIMHVMNEFR